MRTKYTPAEIIAGGVADTRETFAELYVELHELRQEAAAYYYRAFVDTDNGAEPTAPAFHPAPPGFGGNELARPSRRVDLTRLTDAGLTLYVFGVRSALVEREELVRQVEAAQHDLERMLIAMDGTIADVVSGLMRRAAALDRRTSAPPEMSPLEPWDVPVRQPGTENYL
jgi:hypothetical protein